MNIDLYNKQLQDIKQQWICTKKIAHRGLWDNKDIIENTISAFENAIVNGFAIETDVWCIKDGTLVIFHDDTLDRMCGIDKNIWDIESLEELRSYTIMNKEKIPTFDEFLELVDGRTEILIEIKGYSMNGKTENAIYERMKSYNGEYAIESFNSFSLLWFKKHAPEVIRGQLSTVFEHSENENKLFGKIKDRITELRYNRFTKPHFIAYDKNYFPNKYTDKAKENNMSIILWTIKNQNEIEHFKNDMDNIIFDEFIPEN